MVFQLFILGIVIFFAPLVPPILSPLGYSLTGALILQKANPRILSFITVGVAVLTDIIIRKMQNYIIPKFAMREEHPSKEKNIFARIMNKMNSYFRKEERIGRLSVKREKYLEKRTGRMLTFLFAIFCYIPILPDIIGTRILYKKIKFIPFIIAAIIGKSLTHIPFIFLGKSIAQILHLRI